MFNDYFAAIGLATAPTSSLGASVALSFRNAGIPFGGLHTAAAALKTPAEAVLFGGTAGTAFDPCTWRPCDTTAILNATPLDQMSDAAAHVVLLLSRRNFAQKPLGGS